MGEGWENAPYGQVGGTHWLTQATRGGDQGTLLSLNDEKRLNDSESLAGMEDGFKEDSIRTTSITRNSLLKNIKAESAVLKDKGLDRVKLLKISAPAMCKNAQSIVIRCCILLLSTIKEA